mgnify:FL=1
MKFINYTLKLADYKDNLANHKTALNYRAAARSFAQFVKTYLGKTDLELTDLESPLIESYEQWLLKSKRICKNSSSAYIRCLRASYRNAVKKGLCKDLNPFETVYSGTDRTRKRSLDDKSLKKLFAMDLSHSYALMQTRDLFYFSFLAQGMPFVDLVRIRYQDIKVTSRFFRYNRSKSGECVNVRITRKMLMIVDKYHIVGDVYAFSLGINPYAHNEYSNALHRYNRNLRQLAKMLGLENGLSSYCARHSWANQAYRLNIPLSVISCCMGHTNEKTTKIYLASLAETEMHSYVSVLNKIYEPLWQPN